MDSKANDWCLSKKRREYRDTHTEERDVMMEMDVGIMQR